MSKRKIARPGYRQAVALAYDKDTDQAPIVVAAGEGYLADKILNIAQAEGIPVYKDETAAMLLAQLETGEEIPPELYQLVASIYAFILQAAQNKK